MRELAPDLAIIELGQPDEADVDAVFRGPLDGHHDIVMTGADGALWYATAIWSDDVTFAVWPEPDSPVIVYAGADPESLADRLARGVVVLVAGGGLGPDAPAVVQNRVDAPSELVDFFGTDQIIVSSENPVHAALRLLGHPDDATEMLGILGATVTILARSTSLVAQALVGHARSALVTRGSRRPGPALISRLAWTRALGSFQLVESDTIDGIDDILAGSMGPTAGITAEARERAGALLGGDGGDYDIVLAADLGGRTTFVSDLALAFGNLGTVLLTGQAVPPRSVVVLRNSAADAARPHLRSEVSDAVDQPDADGSIVVGPAPSEDGERFVAHQWVGSLRRAADAEADEWLHGGPTLASEANALGLVGPPGEMTLPDVSDWPAEVDTTEWVDGETLAAIAYARGWHVVDPDLPPVLDAALAEIHRQIAGGDSPITTALLDQIRTWGAQPGFWADLPSATEPPTTDTKGNEEFEIVFPYPLPTVELLRAMVATDGDPAELRHLLGPLKVAVLTALGPRQDSGEASDG